MSNDLTIEQLQTHIKNYRDGFGKASNVPWYIMAAEQLLATMQREERLREALEHIANTSQAPFSNPIAIMRYTAKMALKSCEYRVNQEKDEK